MIYACNNGMLETDDKNIFFEKFLMMHRFMLNLNQ